MKSPERLPSGLAMAHLLSESEQGLSLMGSRCATCDEAYFPPTASCTACCSSELQSIELGGSGQLWSWTVQGFLPKSPYNSGETEADFSPYGVGYVEMPCGVKVESRLTCSDPTRLRIGMPMQLCLVQYGQRADGTPLHSYAFAPQGEL